MLDLVETRATAGKQIPLRFRIADTTGAPVTRYVESHEKQLHLIVVRRDTVGYQHVHPTLDGSGTGVSPSISAPATIGCSPTSFRRAATG